MKKELLSLLQENASKDKSIANLTPSSLFLVIFVSGMLRSANLLVHKTQSKECIYIYLGER